VSRVLKQLSRELATLAVAFSGIYALGQLVFFGHVSW
jgi:hypothetical protein